MHLATDRADRLPRRRRLTAAAATVLIAVTTAACGGTSEPPAASGTTSGTPSPTESASPSESPSSTESASPVLAVRVTGDEVSPVAQQVDLSVGDTLVITVEADRAGELHVHADPEQTFEFDSGTERFELTLETPGSVDVEEHESEVLVARVLVR